MRCNDVIVNSQQNQQCSNAVICGFPTVTLVQLFCNVYVQFMLYSCFTQCHGCLCDHVANSIKPGSLFDYSLCVQLALSPLFGLVLSNFQSHLSFVIFKIFARNMLLRKGKFQLNINYQCVAYEYKQRLEEQMQPVYEQEK